ncbi:MAG: hypothetical protein ACKOFP_13465 [Actinomycetota bacterium]
MTRVITVDAACAAAHAAAPAVAASDLTTRAGWLEAMADALDAARDDLVPIAVEESRLGVDRLTAEAVSPPIVANAKGKFEAEKTATGPSGTFMRRRSGRGGVMSGRALSRTMPRKDPSRTTWAMSRSCPVIRASPTR